MKPSATSRPAMVLVVVVLLIALIAALVFEFSYDARLRLHLADSTRRACQALYCAEAGLAIADAGLQQPPTREANAELARILSGTTQVAVGEGYCEIAIESESGKINVNGLATREGKPARPTIDRLLRLIDLLNAQRGERKPIGYGLVPALMDWVDADNDLTVLPFVQGENAGAEDSYYQRLPKPYHCKNGPLETLGELLFVRGMTRQIFSGETSDKEEGPMVGMSQFLTIYGEGKLNINEAPALAIQTLSESIDGPLAQSLVAHRPYGTLRELAEVPGMTPGALKVLQEGVTVQSVSEYYTVSCRGVVGECVRTIRVVVRKDRAGGRLTPLVRWES